MIKECNVGEEFQGYLLVKECVHSLTKNGDPYIRVVLGDASGTIGSVVWNADEGKKEIFKETNIVVVQGVIGEFNEQKQLNLRGFRGLEEGEEVNLEELLEVAPVEGEKLVKKIEGIILKIENEAIRKITSTLFSKYKEELEKYPAAKGNHHAYVGGLAYHIVGMLRLAKAVCKFYPILNEDLLVAGVILHDIGKVKEYSGYVSPEFTQEGKLKGHISIISEEIGNTALELGIDSEEVLLLQHLALSHHGKMEWGSPVRPAIIEANVLHQLDMVDASMDAYRKASEDVEVGEYTEKIFSMDSRSFYKHGL